jgi:hypothetical protein
MERFVMIEKHLKSRIRNIAGLFLCSVVGVFTLTKAPSSMAQPSLERHLTLSLKDVPIERAIELFADFTGMTIAGVDQIEGTIITIRVSDAPAGDVLTQLLNCVGYTFESSSAVLEIVPLGSPGDASFECLDVEFERDRTV